jgi:uncharacterized RDD family membrane protein YckC
MKREKVQESGENKPLFASMTDRLIASCVDLISIVLPVTLVLHWIALKFSPMYTRTGIGFDANKYLTDNFLAGILVLLSISYILIYLWKKYDASFGKLLFSLRIVDLKTLQKPTNTQYYRRILGYGLQIFPLYLFFAWLVYGISSSQGTLDPADEQNKSLQAAFMFKALIYLSLSLLPFFISLFSIPFTKNHQAFQDRLSSTIVVTSIDKSSKEYKDRKFKRATYILIFTIIGIIILNLLKS